MDVEADSLVLELVYQFRCQARHVDPQTLHPVVKIGVYRFHNRRAPAVVKIHGRDAPGVDVVKKTSITHASNRRIAGSHGRTRRRSCRCHPPGSSTEHLPAQEKGDPDGQEPEKDRTPALVHGGI